MLFTKGHGTGNDFVILPDPDGQLTLPPEFVAAVCHRRTGIGADGILRVVRSAKHPEAADLAGEAEWFMDYRNADGSLAEMCGNGVRVFTRYLVANGLAEPTADGLPVATRAGVVRAVIGPDTIGVTMRTPRVYAGSTATLGALTMPGVAVDCGNPHLVCAVHDGITLDALDLLTAPEHDPSVFPDGVNVEFVAPGAPIEGADLHVHMRVSERGSGETLSCGSGALAVGAVALRDAGLDAGTVAVDLPGGRLTVTVDDGLWHLTGPAVLLASGHLDVNAFGLGGAVSGLGVAESGLDGSA